MPQHMHINKSMTSKKTIKQKLYHDPDGNTKEIDDSPEISSSLLWETSEAVQSEKLILYSTHTEKKQLELENNWTHTKTHRVHTCIANPADQTRKEMREITLLNGQKKSTHPIKMAGFYEVKE